MSDAERIVFSILTAGCAWAVTLPIWIALVWLFGASPGSAAIVWIIVGVVVLFLYGIRLEQWLEKIRGAPLPTPTDMVPLVKPETPLSRDQITALIEQVKSAAVAATGFRPIPSIYDQLLYGVRDILDKWPPTTDNDKDIFNFLKEKFVAFFHYLPKEAVVREGQELRSSPIVATLHSLYTFTREDARAPFYPLWEIFDIPVTAQRAAVNYPDKRIYGAYIALDQVIPSSDPLYSVFDHLHTYDTIRVPIPYEYDNRFSHMQIVGTNKSGKTTLLKRLILHDLLQEKPPSLVIVDTHSDLTEWVAHLDLFHPEHGKLKDKLIIFSPRDLPPAINIFHRNADKDADQVAEAAIESLRYMFTGLGVDLTGKQGLLFEPCVRFLLTLPDSLGRNATLRDFIRLLQEQTPEEFTRAIRALPHDDEIREFMEQQFNTKTYDDTKKDLAYRLEGIRNKGAVGRLFRAQDTKVNLFERLNEGAVILIDASQDYLKSNAPLYGRFFIALVLQAVFERATIPERYRKPTFLYCDESQYWFDQNTKTLLTDARKFKLGGVFAHHGLKDLDEELRAYLTGETAIRMVGRPFPDDVNALARALHTEPEVLTSQKQYHFTTWIDGMKKTLSTTADDIGRQDRMSDEAYADLLRRNRENVALIESPPPEEPIDIDLPKPNGKVAEPPPAPSPNPPAAASPEPTPRRNRPRPRKRRGPLTGDIDTSA